MKLKLLGFVLNDNNFTPKMFKPPDNPSIGSEDNHRYFQHHSSQKPWRGDKRRQQVYSYQKSQGSYQRNQQLYQNNKIYSYRTCKWLQFYRIAYPDPYSGPGPGPGLTKCNQTNSRILYTSASPAIPLAGPFDEQASPSADVNQPVVIISPPSQITFQELCSKSSHQSTSESTLTAHKTRIVGIQQKNQPQYPHQTYQQRQKKYQKHRQRWMFGRNFLWLLIVLIFFDSGPLHMNLKLSAATMVADKTTTIIAASGDSNNNKERDNHNNNIRTTSNFGMGNNNNNNNNNYTKFLNTNAYNNRNDIIKSSNTYTNINSKYSFNDYKNLFLNYNDISSNNNDKYNTNQYYSTKNNKLTNRNRKFSYIKDNTSNNTNTYMNNMSHNNDANANKMDDTSADSNRSQRTNSNSYSKIGKFNAHSSPDNNADSVQIEKDTPEGYSPTPSNAFQPERPSVSSLIMQKKNSMKASLRAIRNFKLDEALLRSSPVRTKSKLPVMRPVKQMHLKNMPGGVKGSPSISNEETIHQQQITRKQQAKKNKSKSKRTTDNNNIKLAPIQTQGNREEYIENVGELPNRVQQYTGRRNHEIQIPEPFHQQFHDQEFQQDERRSSHLYFTNDRDYNKEIVTSEELQQLQDRQKQLDGSPHYNHGHYYQQPHPHDSPKSRHEKEHQLSSMQESYEPASEPYDENSPMDINYKRSLLASISCPNCVYNIDPYLTAELFAPSLLSASPILSSSSSSLSSSSLTAPSSSSQLKRYQNGNLEIKSHQHQQHDLLHQQHVEQYPPYSHNSLQYSTISNNNNKNNNEDSFNNYDNNPKQYYNNKKLNNNNNIYNRNTINGKSNSFHQPFHQFDSDQIRLESIKHQILSKLGLKAKPNVTQTLPKQFIMETIYRAESSGRNGLKSTPVQYSDSSARSMKSSSFSDSEFKHESSANDFLYSDYANTNGHRQDIDTRYVSPSAPLSPQLSKSRSSFSPYTLTRRTGQLPDRTVGEIDDANVDSDDFMIETNSETLGRYLHQQDQIVGDRNIFSSSSLSSLPATVSSSLSSIGSSDMSTDSPILTSSPLSSSTPSPSSEQDDFYGRTKEIITFAEKGGILNGHRLIEFSSLSDQMTGQNLRIRTASMWIRVDLRPIADIKRYRKPTARLKLSPVDSILKVWVFRLIEPYATTLNTTEFVKKDFDQITTLSTTLNVQFNQLGWQKLDITETVQRWYANDRHMRLRLLVDCSGCGDLITLHLFGNEPPKSADNPSNIKTSKLHNHGRSHHRHQHQRHRPPHARKPGTYSSQKHSNVPSDKQRYRVSTNRTSSTPFRKHAHVTLFLDEGQSQSVNRHYVYRNESRTKALPTLRHRSNEITKPTAIPVQPPLLHQDVSSFEEHTEVDPNRPFLVIHTEPNVMKRVRRRALDCSGALNGQCCKESFYVSFKALGWDDWIIAPHGYFANYCRGDCAGPRTPDTYQSYHTHVMEEFRKLDRLTGMQPCCAPLKFSSMSLIYYGKEGIIKRDLPKMVVDECGCP